MRNTFALLMITLLFGCTFDGGGFRPPPKYYSWKTKKISIVKNMMTYLEIREQDMRDCGIDPVSGESVKAKSNLCMESKGWYSNKSPVCEDKVMDSVYSDPLCIQWRAKHHKK